mgnify:CR=1 FL=1
MGQSFYVYNNGDLRRKDNTLQLFLRIKTARIIIVVIKEMHRDPIL